MAPATLCKDTVIHSESQMARAQWVCSEAGNRTIVAIIGLMIAYVALFSALLSRLTVLACHAT